ncbi:hypothetical protein [Promicromonospora soli]|uniref:hypothetical protein n=1 Tax=Promicromonospora soli TaxID=2035533 RepID=UPI001679B98A|nr:hypothetical protein [Promicromonospora soli]
MNDVDLLMEQCSWLAQQSADVGMPGPHQPVELMGMPVLSGLLSAATVTPVRLDGVDHELLAWGPVTDRRGWLCRLPVHHADDTDLPEVLRAVWAAMCGIVEHFGDVSGTWWWLNCNDVLTREAADWPVEQMLAAYEWMWTDEGLRIPIEAADYVPVAAEANGNLTLAHRRTGQVLWFAPDHSESGVSVLAGCPEYSLYTFDGVPDLASWIETGAAQWARP